LSSQFVKHGSQEPPYLAIELLLATFGHTHDVVFAVLFGMT
jgi:hypothetical protein